MPKQISFHLEAEIPDVADLSKPDSPAGAFMAQLFTALKQLEGLAGPNGNPRLCASIRTAAGLLDLEDYESYDPTSGGECDPNPDHTEHGWWMFVLFLYDENGGISPPSVNFYSKDFEDDASRAQAKFAQVFALIENHLALPKFSPDRIARALQVFSDTSVVM